MVAFAARCPDDPADGSVVRHGVADATIAQ
jgi:hypothetical protein